MGVPLITSQIKESKDEQVDVLHLSKSESDYGIRRYHVAIGALGIFPGKFEHVAIFSLATGRLVIDKRSCLKFMAPVSPSILNHFLRAQPNSQKPSSGWASFSIQHPASL